MKNIKLILVSALALAVLVVGIKITFSVINDNMRRDAESAEETAEIAFTPIETEEPEIIFTPIETSEIKENESETNETAETILLVDTTEAVSASGTDIQQEIPQVAEITDQDVAVEQVVIPQYDDVMLLAKIIQNEAGADIATDEHQRAVASVVLNRVNDSRFPDTVYGVISQGWNGECPAQYAVGGAERFFSLVPSERAISNAEYVLTYGSTVPGAIWQAEFVQGEIVAVFEYPGTGFGTTYICR